MSELWPELAERAEELMVFKMPKNQTLIDEIFKFDPRNLETLSSVKLSAYSIGLMQFVVFLTSQVNKTRVLLMQKERVLEVYFNKEVVLKGKTKADKKRELLKLNPELVVIQKEAEILEAELKLTENYDKYLVELNNSIKRELTRREAEMKFIRDERRA